MRRRSSWSSAMRALIIEKAHLHPRATPAGRRRTGRSGRPSPISPVPRSGPGQAAGGPAARRYWGTCGKITMAPDARDVDQPDDVFAAAKFERGGARDRRACAPRRARRSSASRCRGIIPPSRMNTGRHCNLPPHRGGQHLSQRRLRIGLRRMTDAMSAECCRGRHWRGRVHRVYGCAGRWSCSFKMNGLGMPMGRSCEIDDVVAAAIRCSPRPPLAQRAAQPHRRRPPAAVSRRAGPAAIPAPRRPAGPRTRRPLRSRRRCRRRCGTR